MVVILYLYDTKHSALVETSCFVNYICILYLDYVIIILLNQTGT